METAGKLVEDEELAEAMRERGLGTPATRAQTIDNLLNTKYIERAERNLLATQKGERLIDFLDAMDIDTLKSPSMTGEWECKLRKMEQGQFSREQFMGEIRELTRAMAEKVKGFDESDERHTRPSQILSPIDGKPLRETLRGYVTEDRSLTIPRVVAGREWAAEEVVALLRDGRVGPFDNFLSRFGKPFRASALLEGGKVRLEFENAPGDGGEALQQLAETVERGRSLCDCPSGCGGKVYVGERGYVCERFLQKKCAFRVAPHMLGHRLTEEEILAMAKDGKTPLIEDFVSNRTGKAFRAFLLVDKTGKISFNFPPREPKTAAGKAKKGPANDSALSITS
jgi:DNA topoisomerase-3